MIVLKLEKDTKMTATIPAPQDNIPAQRINVTIGQAMWLPKRTSKHSWEEVELALGVVRTGRIGTEMQAACEVIVPDSWKIVDSKVSPFLQRWLVDENGKLLAKLFYKLHRADFIEWILQ